MLSVERCFYSSTKYLYAWKYDRTIKRQSLRLCHSRNTRGIQTLQHIATQQVQNDEEDESEFDKKIVAIKDKLLYCDYLERKKLKLGFKRNTIAKNIQQNEDNKRKLQNIMNEPVLSVALKYLTDNKKSDRSQAEKLPEQNLEVTPVQMPYANKDHFETREIPQNPQEVSSTDEDLPLLNENYKIMYEKYVEESKLANSENTKKTMLFTESTNRSTTELKSVRLPDDLSKVPLDWMTDYEEYDDSTMEEQWRLNYGTPKPNSKVSSVPCGGCGALLHCKDTAIPGYLPSELFLGRNNNDLQNMTCQRCHFLKNYNTALGVNVAPEEYPKLLESIRDKRAAVILMVDLMDFPCSIWPGIMSIIGERRPVFVVGNKVDLLPQDSPNFFYHVQKCLSQSMQDTGISIANIKNVMLISSKTGFGVEELINKLHNFWKYKGDVFLIGCTNVGKSTLFNALLQSDYCKVQAVDLIQRATTSPWPGTTLNLLKFPILRPSDWRLYMRTQRLVAERREKHALEKLRNIQLNETKNLKYATLIGHIGRTFAVEKPVTESADIFKIGSTLGPKDQKKFGLNENDKDYKHSRWCYDTPGTVQPDQVLHLLTTDELVLTLPRTILIPRTFLLKQNHSLFLAGLGRLDYLEGSLFMRCTVFASDELPITICHNDHADEVYQELLQTEAFAVPFNDPERLKLWPELVSKNFEITGISWNESAADVVLSSAGWVAVTPAPERQITVRAWTPEGRGIYLRRPALLKHSVALRGHKTRDSPAYKQGLPIYRKP